MCAQAIGDTWEQYAELKLKALKRMQQYAVRAQHPPASLLLLARACLACSELLHKPGCGVPMTRTAPPQHAAPSQRGWHAWTGCCIAGMACMIISSPISICSSSSQEASLTPRVRGRQMKEKGQARMSGTVSAAGKLCLSQGLSVWPQFVKLVSFVTSGHKPASLAVL